MLLVLGGGVVFCAPLYRSRAGIVRRSASLAMMFKENNICQQELLLLSCCSFDHVSSDINIRSCDYYRVSFASLFMNLCHPRDFR